jgi:hypothetical protein
MQANNRGIAAALTVCGMVLAPFATALAALTPLSSEFRIDDANPEASVPGPAARNAKPLEFGYFIQDLLSFAESAARSGDHVAEARYYRAFTRAVPDSAVGFSRLCESLAAADRRDDATVACRAALGLHGATVKDHVRFVELVLSKHGQLSLEEIEDLKQVVAHLRSNPETAVAGHHLQCQLGVRIESIPLLEECTKALAVIAPEDPKTITFEWALAVRKGDPSGGRREIARARALGMNADQLARMERLTAQLEPAWRRGFRGHRVFWLTFAVGASCGLAVFFIRRRRSSAGEGMLLASPTRRSCSFTRGRNTTGH